jgi:hypothetical protein
LDGRGTFSSGDTYYPKEEDVMKAHLTKLPTRTWLLIVVPAIVIAYPIARIVVPAVVHAVVPEVVRSVLSMI